jgi:hypothetical protein
MTPELPDAAGEALFGPDWLPSQLAGALGLNPRAMRRVLAGEQPIPRGIASGLLTLAAARVLMLQRLLSEAVA